MTPDELKVLQAVDDLQRAKPTTQERSYANWWVPLMIWGAFLNSWVCCEHGEWAHAALFGGLSCLMQAMNSHFLKVEKQLRCDE